MPSRLASLIAVLLSQAACLNSTPPPPAPDAVDQNLQWFWVHGAALGDAELAAAAAKLGVSGKADSRTTPLKTLTHERLAPADLEPVGLEKSNDPSTARGLMIVNLFPCTLDTLERLLIAQDQAAQYTGVYDAYTRTYTSDLAAYTDRKKATLDWTVDMKASLPINDGYAATIKGGIRRVAAPADGATKGPFLVTRTWLTAPATFSSGSTSYFRQDYQVEVFWEQAPGTIFHAYAMWRDMKAGGVNLSIEDNGFVNVILDNLVKWDDTTAGLCAK